MSTHLAHAEPLQDARIYVSLWLMLMVATFARLQVENSHFGSLFALIFWGVLFTAGLMAGRQHARQASLVHKQLGDGAAIVGLLALIFNLGDLTHGLLLLLTWMQLAKCFTLAQRRDLFFSLGVSFVLMVFAASRSKHTVFLFLLALYTLAAIYTLILAHADNRRQRATGHQTADNGSNPFPASSLLLTTAILSLAGGVYLITPRPAAINLGAYPDHGGTDYHSDSWQEEAEGFRSPSKGIGESEDGSEKGEPGPDTQAPRHTNNYKGLDTSFDINAPGPSRSSPGNGIVLYLQAPQGLYLRGRVFDHFDGLHWHQTEREERKFNLKHGFIDLDVPPGGKAIHQIIEIASDSSDVLVATPSVARLGFPGTVVARDQDGTLRIPRTLRAGTRYEAFSRQHFVGGRPAQPTPELHQRQRYLQLPENFDPGIADLARRASAGATTPLQVAAKLESHLRENYAYSFETIFNSQNTTPLGEFLFQTRRGHCEYFASAMTIMLRSVDIPARLVTGFSATTYNPVTGYYEVRALDGHAWTEAWLSGQGWVSFEPTAFYKLPEENSTTTAGALDRYLARLDQIEQATRHLHPSASLWDTIENTLREAWRLIRDGSRHLADQLADVLSAHMPLIAGVALVAALTGFGFQQVRPLLRDRLAHWRIRRGPGPDRAAYLALCYLECEAWLTRRGLPRAPADTLEEYVRAVSRAYPGVAQSFRQLVRHHGSACYGGLSPDEGMLRHARAVFDEIAQHVTARQLTPTR